MSASVSGDLAGAALREEIAAEERARRRVEHEAAFPRMRHVRRVEPAHRVRPERELLAVRERARRAVGEVADRDHRRHLAADGHGVRRGCEELVERAALVGFEVR